MINEWLFAHISYLRTVEWLASASSPWGDAINRRNHQALFFTMVAMFGLGITHSLFSCHLLCVGCFVAAAATFLLSMMIVCLVMWLSLHHMPVKVKSLNFWNDSYLEWLCIHHLFSL